MSDSTFFAAFFFPSAAAVIIFAMKYVASVRQARVRLAQDDAYRDIASKAASAQADMAAALTSFGTMLVEVQARLATLEKILRQVE
jgi:hypothetical protein